MSALLRVGLVIGQLHRGGTERQVYELASRMLGGPCEPCVYCLSAIVEPFGTLISRAGVKLRILPRRRSYELSRILALARWIAADRIEVVHSLADSPNLYACLALLRAGRRPFLVSNRAMDTTLSWMAVRLNRIVFRLSDRVVVNSGTGARYTRETYGLPAEKIEVVPNGLNPERFRDPTDPSAVRSSLGIPTGSPVIGFVGRFSAEKRPEHFLEACMAVSSRLPEARYLMVGDGPSLPEIRRHVRETGFDSKVTFTGFRDDIPDLLGAMDLIMLTSSQEGLPNAILEAMAAGRPVVATDVGGCRELVLDGITGYLVEMHDRSALAARAVEILSLPDRGRALGEAGRRRVASEFSVDAMVARFQDLYLRVHAEAASRWK